MLNKTAISLVTLCLITAASHADDSWTQFRGNNHSGIANPTAELPVKWDLEKHTVWETELPGTGWSSPVYANGKIWLTTAITTEATPEKIADKKKGVSYPDIKTVAASVEFHALCIELATGNVLHDLLLSKIDEPELINPLNSYASPTAAIKDGKVVCHFGSYGTWCLDAETGKTIWHQAYVIDHGVGPGSSPVIVDDHVILVCDGMDKQFIVAVELESGTQKWLTKRPPMRSSNPDFQKAYCTPLLIEVAGQRQAVIPGAQWVAGYDPQTGKELWRADHGKGFSVVPMAAFEAGMIVFSTGYGRPEFVAVDPTGTGDVSKTHIKWRTQNAPAMPSFVSQNGQVIAITDKGILSRLDAQSGDVVERIRIGGNFSASPLLSGDHLYLSSREGALTVVKLADKFKKVSQQKFANPIMASPAVVGNDLIIRTEKKLYRIGAGM